MGGQKAIIIMAIMTIVVDVMVFQNQCIGLYNHVRTIDPWC